MTSFALRLEPGAAPRLAAVASLVHLAAAASPWLLGVPAAISAVLSAAALAGLASTLACVPGPHHAMSEVQVDAAGCRMRLAGSPEFVPAALGTGSRVLGPLAFVEVRTGARRHAWLLTRGSIPPGPFRRLKARIRFSC